MANPKESRINHELLLSQQITIYHALRDHLRDPESFRVTRQPSRLLADTTIILSGSDTCEIRMNLSRHVSVQNSLKERTLHIDFFTQDLELSSVMKQSLDPDGRFINATNVESVLDNQSSPSRITKRFAEPKGYLEVPAFAPEILTQLLPYVTVGKYTRGPTSAAVEPNDPELANLVSFFDI